MKRMSGNALEFCKLRLAYDRNDSMPLIWQLPRVNSLRMDAEMLLITHVYQPIVAPPAIWVDDAIECYLARITACSDFLEAFGNFRVDLSLPFQDSEDDCFTPGSTPLFSNTAGAKKGFIHFSLAGKRQ